MLEFKLFYQERPLGWIYSSLSWTKPCKELNTRNDEANDKFTELGLDVNEKKAVIYLYTGFQNACPLFVDWSLSKFIINCHQSSRAVCDVLKVLTFFPSETRQLSVAFNMICRRNNLSIFERFLIYQVHRVKIMRQSSISVDATDKLVELKTQSKDLEGELRYFWTLDKPFISFTEVYAEKEQSLRALWEEAIKDYPNNPRMAQEYAKFLTECSTMFDDAIMMSQRSTLIENGRNFSTDIAFRSMVQIFQIYLKNGIVDFKGNVIQKKPIFSSSEIHHGSSNGGNSSDMSYNDTITLNPELEEILRKQLITNGRIRLALHNSIKDRKTCSMIYYGPLSIIISLLLVVVFIVIFFVIEDLFVTPRSSMDRMVSVTDLRMTLDMSQYSIFLRVINETHRLFNFDIYNKLIDLDDLDHQPMVSLEIDLNRQIHDFIQESRVSFYNMMEDIAGMAYEGINIYDVAEIFVSPLTKLTVCSDDYPLDPTMSNLKDSIIYILHSQSDMSRDADASNWYHSNKYCEDASNHGEFMTKSADLFKVFYNDKKERITKVGNILFISMIAVSAAVFLLLFISQEIFVLSFVKELRDGLNALSSINDETREEAMNQIVLGSSDQKTICKIELSTSHWILRGVIWFFVSLVIGFLCLLMFYEACVSCEDILHMNGWIYFASLRLSSSKSSGLRILQSVVFNGSITSNFYDPANIRKSAAENLL